MCGGTAECLDVVLSRNTTQTLTFESDGSSACVSKRPSEHADSNGLRDGTHHPPTIHKFIEN